MKNDGSDRFKTIARGASTRSAIVAESTNGKPCNRCFGGRISVPTCTVELANGAQARRSGAAGAGVGYYC